LSDRSHKRPIVTACLNADGNPDFALTEVNVTPEEIDNGAHYYLAEAHLLDQGYEEPFVHFAEDESPAFLHPAVRQHLRVPLAETTLPILPEEETSCPASSK
jgi:hypothetical protein